MKIQFYRKSNYGRDLNYLFETEEAHAVQRLIDQKTISDQQIRLFGALGIQFEEVLAPRN